MKFRVVTQDREDAISIYNDEVVGRLKEEAGFVHTHFDLSTNYWLMDIILQVLKSIRLILKLEGEKILLTDPKTIKAQLLAYFTANEKAIVVHHLDEDPIYFQLLPGVSISSMLHRFDQIICISEFSRNQVRSRGICNEKIDVAYYGINHEVFSPASTESPLESDYILHVGTEIERKNIPVLLQTFKKLSQDFKDLKLVLVGPPGTNQARERTLKEMEDLGITEKVVLTGRIPQSELSKYYSNAELFLFPSLLEGFGMPLVEAMACGCPVVTSDRNPMKELTGRTQKTVNPKDLDEMVKGCREVLTNTKKREKMIEDGKKRSKTFSWDKCASIIYNKLLE